MRTGRPITNRSNFFSGHHWRLLWKLALQITAKFRQFDPAELVNIGWLYRARYYPSVVGKSHWIKGIMYRYIEGEIERMSHEPLFDYETTETTETTVDNRDELSNLLSKLTNRDMEICLQANTGYRLKEVAKRHGITTQTARTIRKRARNL